MKEENVGRQSLERRPEEKYKEDWCEVGKMVEVKSTGSVNKILRVSDDDGVLLDSGVWRCRTELRPYSDPEPQWVPGELPPVGERCEMRRATHLNWYEVIVRSYHGSRYAWVDDDGLSGEIIDLETGNFQFRPLKSHRDKVIEAVAGGLGDLCPLPEVLNAIYDIGALKLPEGE